MNLPMAPSPALPTEDIPALKEEVRALAQERGAVILAQIGRASCRERV